MARPESRYVCGTCGAESLRWEGQCRGCGAWNTLVETPVSAAASSRASGAARRRRAGGNAAQRDPTRPTRDRSPSASRELDRVLGGGLVPGLAGAARRRAGHRQVDARAGAVRRASRAARTRPRPVRVGRGIRGPAPAARRRASAWPAGRRRGRPHRRPAPRPSVERIVAAAEATAPALLIVDSIQTLTTDELDGPAGSVGQVRAAAARLQAFAKEQACRSSWSAT